MSNMIVSTDGLNLRSSPQQLPDNILLSLPLAQEVEVLNAPDGQRFWEVETTINGQNRRGFASSRFLRAPLSATKEKLIKAAVKEWIFFHHGDGLEQLSPFAERVGDFWRAININLDGRDRDNPWSAAYISFIVRAAGYNDFKFSDGHATYIRDAKAKRLSSDANAPFWLFRLNEHKPQIGDLVCGWRETPRTYDNLPSGFFKSHTDVVVETDGFTIKTLGGNVDQSVRQKTFALKSDGFLKAENKIFAIMRNNR